MPSEKELIRTASGKSQKESEKGEKVQSNVSEVVRETVARLQGPHTELVQDIKPGAPDSDIQQGVVELTLDKGTSIKAVGLLYGLEHQLSESGFSACVYLDQYSRRLKLQSYEATDIDALIDRLNWLAAANEFDKIICMASRHDWQDFLRRGYVLEAVLKYYRGGEDAYVMSRFRSQKRLYSESLMEETLLIEKIMEAPLPKGKIAPADGYEFRLARREDIPELIKLYQTIFETYPSPLVHSEYLETVFNKENLYAVATKDGEIVAAASAELNKVNRAAELTDCATRKVARGKGLMSRILRQLEMELLERDYICAYTIARARSYGMHNVFYRLGYEFMGRLVNNCQIYGDLEDMTIWVKDLRPLTRSDFE